MSKVLCIYSTAVDRKLGKMLKEVVNEGLQRGPPPAHAYVA